MHDLPPGGATVHAGFRDPGTEREQPAVFRAVSGRITDWIDTTFGVRTRG